MADLGDFGAALAELDAEDERTPQVRDTFSFLGEQFVVQAEIPPVLMLQLGASATGRVSEAEGFGAMWEALRCSLTQPETGSLGQTGYVAADDASFKRFYRMAVARNADLESIMRLVFALFEAQSGRPTKRAPGSSAGPPSTSPTSSATSSHPALAHLRPVSEVLAG